MASRKPFPRKLKPAGEYMIDIIEEHTIALEKILRTVKEISKRVDVIVEDADVLKKHYSLWEKKMMEAPHLAETVQSTLGESTKLDIE